MDTCAAKPPHSNKLLEEVEAALKIFPGGKLAAATLSKEFGVAAATDKEADCTVSIENAELTGGPVVRVHDLYTDPTLTDCARKQSNHAGIAFMKWLRENDIVLDWIASSFLMRAVETARAMFIEPCLGEPPMMNCSHIFRYFNVEPIPYMTERAPPNLTPLQADNTPRPLEEQVKLIEELFGDESRVVQTFGHDWDRYAQNFEKFKALMSAVILPEATWLDWVEPNRADFRNGLEASLPKSMKHEDHFQNVSFTWKDSKFGMDGHYETGPTFSKEEWLNMPDRIVNVVVVGHNQMMMEYCQAGKPPKPNNNAVLEKLFHWEARTDTVDKSYGVRTILREMAEPCRLVMDAPSGADSMASLSLEDVEVCAAPLTVSNFLDLKPKEGDKEAPSKCEALSLKKDAYKIQGEFTEDQRWTLRERDHHRMLKVLDSTEEEFADLKSKGLVPEGLEWADLAGRNTPPSSTNEGVEGEDHEEGGDAEDDKEEEDDDDELEKPAEGAAEL